MRDTTRIAAAAAVLLGAAALAANAADGVRTVKDVAREHNYPERYCALTETPEQKAALVEELWRHEKSAETRLWPEGRVPMRAGDAPVKNLEHELWQRNLVVTDVNDPFFTFFPAKGPGTKPVVVILPGGGYYCLGWNKEGTEIAEWLNSIGFSAALLLYRAPNQREAALADAQRTVGLLRRDAAKYSIDPGRVGVIGFSAGANLAVSLSTNWRKRVYERVDDADDFPCRPDFQMPIYPWDLRERDNPSDAFGGWHGMEIRPEYPVDSETPPAFIAQAADDFCQVETAVAYDCRLRLAGVKSEIRIYDHGGHGYGRRRLGNPCDIWSDQAVAWLAEFMKPQRKEDASR